MVTKSESESAISWRYRVIYTVLLTAWIVGIVTLFNFNKGQVEGGRGQEVILHQHQQAPASGSKAAHLPMSVLPDVRNGNQAALSAYPFMAALCISPQRGSGNPPDCACGAVIVDASQVVGVRKFLGYSKKYLLTAAHCLYWDGTTRRIRLEELEVYMGFVDRRNLPPVWSGLTSWYYKNSIEDNGIAIHPNYRRTVSSVPDKNDIAILKLRHGMPWVDGRTNNGYTYGTVGAINVVGAGQASPASGRMRVIGWGRIEPPAVGSASPSSNHLRWADVDVVDTTTCDATYHTETGHHVPATGILCAGGPQNGANVFPVTCKGDSGGPIVQADATGAYTLWGITSMGISTGDECGRYPALYTEVSPHIPWIKAVLTWMDSNTVPLGRAPAVPASRSQCATWPLLWT